MSMNSVKQQSDLLNNTILPQNEQFSQTLKDFLHKECEDFSEIENSLNQVMEEFKSKYEESKSNVEEIERELVKKNKFANTGKGFLNAKSEEIKSKAKNIDAVSTGIKQTVSKIKPLKLAQLPVDKDNSLTNIFSTLYAVLYHEKKSQFSWKTFRKLALKHEDGEDFVFRLVNINFKELGAEYEEILLILKNDPEFENTCLNSEHAYEVIDLADWVEYVCVGYKFSKEKASAEKEYEKIRRDMSKKTGGTLEKSKEFWDESARQLDSFQNNLMSLESEIKTLKIGSENSLHTIRENQEWIADKVARVNADIQS